MNDKMLIEAACEAQSNAYAPYSDFKVGAALWGDDGQIYTGVNVENCSHGLTVCAERSTVSNAVSHGCKSFKKLVIYSSCSPPATPCGACRQVLFEFTPDLEILCVNNSDETNHYTLSQLLPDAFRSNRH